MSLDVEFGMLPISRRCDFPKCEERPKHVHTLRACDNEDGRVEMIGRSSCEDHKHQVAKALRDFADENFGSPLTEAIAADEADALKKPTVLQ